MPFALGRISKTVFLVTVLNTQTTLVN